MPFCRRTSGRSTDDALQATIVRTLYPGSRRAQFRARDGHDAGAQGGHRHPEVRLRSRKSRSPKRTSTIISVCPEVPLRPGRGTKIRSVWSPVWRGPEFGGELLTIEGVKMPGKGKMTVTGNLRDVMKESISAANVLCPQPGAVDFGIEPPMSSTSRTFTSTCPRARRRRTDRRRALPWQPRSFRS